MLWTGAWCAHWAEAQTPPKQRWCLSFHEVHPSMTAGEAQRKGVPTGYRIYPAPGGSPWEKELLLREEPVMHGGEMVDAIPSFDVGRSSPIIEFRFNAAGTRKFAAFT